MRIALIVIPLVVLAAVGGFIAWKVIGLKQRLVTQLETALHAHAQIGSLNLDLGQGEMLATNISLQNVRPDAPWNDAAIDQVAIHFHFADLFASTLPLQVEITGWKATLHTAAGAASAPAPSFSSNAPTETETMPDAFGDTGPSWIRVNQVAAANGEVNILLGNGESMILHGVTFHASTPGGPEWTTQLQVDSIATATLTTGTGSVELHSTADAVTFSNLAIRCGDAGQISGGGDLALGAAHALKGNFTATSVPLSMLVTTRWQMKLSGLVSGSVTYAGDDTSATATGKLSVAQGKFSLLPWLGKATMLVGLPDITNTELDQATSDFTWKNRVLTLQNIDVRKTDVFRLAGQADVASDDTIDGKLKLGLPSVAVSKWPKLQTDVFNSPDPDPADQEFAWTDVHLTGTPDALQEDLSSRLLQVGAEQGTELLQQTKLKASDLLKALLK